MDNNVIDLLFKKNEKKHFETILYSNKKIEKSMSNLVSVDKQKLGKSGAKVFVEKENIVKMYTNKLKNPYDYQINKKRDCVHLSNILQEMIINYILNNISMFITKAKYNQFIEKNFKTHIIKVTDFGFYQKNSYIIQQKIGYGDCITLTDLLKTGESINKIIPKLEKYFEVLKFLNTTLDFFHTDLKSDNVFLKSYRDSFICMVSDLDKSGLKINGFDIFPREENLSHKIAKTKPISSYDNIYKFRYQCQRNKNFCNRFKPYHYDRITLLMDVYIILLKGKNLQITEEFESFIVKSLGLKQGELELFQKSIKNNTLLMRAKTANIGFHINYSMYSFCKLLKKKGI